MRALRTILSALAVLGGALALVLWAVCSLVVHTVEDPETVRTVTVTVLRSPALMDRIADATQAQALDGVDEQGVDLEAVGAAAPVREAIDDLTHSEAFADTIADQIDAGREQLEQQLTDPLRLPAPFVLRFEVSDLVNARLQDVSMLDPTGQAHQLPAIDVAPVEIELVSATTFERARTTYSRARFAADWFLYVGLALIALGMLVSTRKRYFLPKVLLAAGAMAGVGWLLLMIADVPRWIRLLPGSTGDTWASALADALAEHGLSQLESRLMWIAVIGLGLGGLGAVLAHVIPRRR